MINPILLRVSFLWSLEKLHDYCTEGPIWKNINIDYVPKTYLLRHQRMHDGEKPFKSSHCDKNFLLKSTFVLYQRIHSAEILFCIIIVPKGLHKPLILGSSDNIFQCSHCGNSFSQKSIVLVHQRTHIWEKPYQCSHCGMGFFHKDLYPLWR